MPAYDLTAPYSPKGDQPTAIKQLVAGVNSGERYQTCLLYTSPSPRDA